MLTLADAIINGSALWKIVVASFAGGGGLAIAFGILLLGLDRAESKTSAGERVFNYTVAVLAGTFCIGAVAVGIWAMTQK
jgi:hypothetical protein